VITSACEQWVNSHLPDTALKNWYVNDYMRHEITTRSTCPLCGEEVGGYIELCCHLSNVHNAEEVAASIDKFKYLFDPLAELTDMDLMKRNKNPDIVSIGQFFGDIISSIHNQHVMLNIIGKTGMGKSNAALYIAAKVSNYLAKKYGKTPADYFTMDNVAIMRLDTIIPILKELDNKRHNVFIFDDIGGEWGARNAQTKQNKEINKIIQTFRDTNTLAIFTTPDSFLIDKVGRKLAHFQIELTKTMFEYGMTVGKLKQMMESYQTGSTYYKFPTMYDVQYKRILFRKVDENIDKEYNAKRSIIRKQFTKDSISAISCSDEPDKQIKQKKYEVVAPLVSSKMAEFPSISKRALAKMLNVHIDTITNAIRYNSGEI
jgi:hypothetical protein